MSTQLGVLGSALGRCSFSQTGATSSGRCRGSGHGRDRGCWRGGGQDMVAVAMLVAVVDLDVATHRHDRGCCYDRGLGFRRARG